MKSMKDNTSIPLFALGLCWLTGAQAQEVLKLWAGEARPYYTKRGWDSY